ncbi:MAG: GGDEF domain-containing protein [Lachnospiraceae bacterium]|nr:GGDEF domain-containing protein [Lachnospiraceae bacterium]
MGNILKNRTRYIVPFMAVGDKKLEINGSGWVNDMTQRGEHDVYQYIIDSVCPVGGILQSHIGQSYRYEKNEGPVLSLLYCPKSNGTAAFEFDITDMGLYLFESRVGFFWYETGDFRPIDTTGSTTDAILSIDELVLFNSKFKELNYGINAKTFKRSNAQGPFTIGNWAARVILDAVGDVSFFASRTNTIYKHDPDNNPLYVPDKALIYNYIAFEDMDMDSLTAYAYHLTKGYKKTYRVPKDIEDRMRFPFGNVLWYACNEGAGYYVVAEEDNRNFIRIGMAVNFMSDYFLLYILALNNRYSMIRFSERIGRELPSDEAAYLSPGIYPDMKAGIDREQKDLYDLEQKVTRLVTEINVFITKNLRASVSYVEHQSDFYDYLTDVFRVNESIASLTTGVSALQRLLAQVVETERFFDNNEEMLSWRKNSEYARVQQEKEVLQSEIYKDELTGLINQKGYLRFAGDIFREAKEQNKILFICSADMNGLKHINDNYGHEEGNRAIRGCIDILKHAAKEEDMIFRTGGDEFVILGFRDSIEGEEERFSAAAEEKKHMLNDGADLPYEIAVSYGPILQDLSDFYGNIDDLFRQSDNKMYAMKVLRDKYRRD